VVIRCERAWDQEDDVFVLVDFAHAIKVAQAILVAAGQDDIQPAIRLFCRRRWRLLFLPVGRLIAAAASGQFAHRPVLRREGHFTSDNWPSR
jgi:hypothetical protein